MAETNEGVFLSAERTSNARAARGSGGAGPGEEARGVTVPEDLGREAACALLEEIYRVRACACVCVCVRALVLWGASGLGEGGRDREDEPCCTRGLWVGGSLRIAALILEGECPGEFGEADGERRCECWEGRENCTARLNTGDDSCFVQGGCVDSTCQPLACLMMTLGEQDVSKLQTGPLSPYT